MKKYIFILTAFALVVAVLNISLYIKNVNSVYLGRTECVSLKSKSDYVRVIGGHISSDLSNGSLTYAVVYFIVNKNMEVFWTAGMVANLGNCSSRR